MFIFPRKLLRIKKASHSFNSISFLLQGLQASVVIKCLSQ